MKHHRFSLRAVLPCLLLPLSLAGQPQEPAADEEDAWPPRPPFAQREGRPLAQQAPGEFRQGARRELAPESLPNAESEPLRVVELFLEMPPERLAMIRSLIERLEQMTPEEREAMRQRIARYREMSEDRRARMRAQFDAIPVEERLLLRFYWRTLPPEEAKAKREKLRSLSPEEHEAYRQELVAEARAAGVTLRPPSPPPDIEIPPPPELLPPPFPGTEGERPPRMPASGQAQ